MDNQNALQNTEQLCAGCNVDISQYPHAPNCSLESLPSKIKPEPTATELLTKRVDLIKEGKYIEVPFPFKGLTKLTKALYPGTVTLLCGAPGSCKSLLLLQCLNHWHNIGVPACMYALEEDLEFHMMRALAQRTITSGLTLIDWVEANIAETQEILANNQGFIDEFAKTVWVPEENYDLVSSVEWIRERAKEGKRVIVVDPITIIPKPARNSWDAETEFVKASQKIAKDYGCSLVFVTHPKNGQTAKPSMEALAGSACYSRFSSTVIWFEAHEDITSPVCTPVGTESIVHNRTARILKARSGEGAGLAEAFKFTTEGLLSEECGPITKK